MSDKQDDVAPEQEVEHPLDLPDDELEGQFPSKAIAFRIGAAMGRAETSRRAANSLRIVTNELLKMVAILERDVEVDTAIATNEPEPKTH